LDVPEDNNVIAGYYCQINDAKSRRNGMIIKIGIRQIAPNSEGMTYK
jgi:S-ribosylhomocysteine lyase LuxS involved in autoinducer biosynthesis